MNTSYRLTYSEITNTWVAVAETIKGRGKRAAGAVLLVAASVMLGIVPATTYAALPNPPAPTQLPTGGQVVAGTAAIAQSAATLNVNQSSNRAAIDWQSFNVGSAAQVNFNQPSDASVTLNRVLDANPSQIFGRINANGQVFLTNPSGVYFAPSASADVGALVATTHSISNADFMAGKYQFTRDGASGSVVNEGSLTAGLGGYIALLAPEVRNQGVIVAQLGTVALAAGETYQLQFDANNTLANILVAPATIAALVDNGKAVHAPGGLIILSAQAAERLQGGVIKNSGTLEATGLVSDGGRILLDASDSITHSGSINADAAPNNSGKGGTVSIIANLANAGSITQIDGTINARGGSLGGDGGFVETSGSRLKIGDTARVDTSAPQGKTGTWLLDPVDFTIAASGGDITGAALGTLLGSNSITIETATAPTASATNLIGTTGSNGDINVNDAASWSANNTLTLNAYNNININSRITASGASGKVALLYGQRAVASGNTSTYSFSLGGSGFAGQINLQAGSNFSTTLGSNGTTTNYTVITDLGVASDATSGSNQTLQGIARSGNLSTKYVLGSNIDATATATWNSSGSPVVYAGFTSIGNTSTQFTGSFDGLGHRISSLAQPYALTYTGLFGQIGTAGTVKNLGLIDATITKVGYGNNTYLIPVGALAGTNAGSVSNVYSTGLLGNGGPDYNAFGGLVGVNTGTIRNAYSSATFQSGGWGTSGGGLVGINSGTISSSYADGAVPFTGRFVNVGGLVGQNTAGSIDNSYATGTVTSGGSPDLNKIGGLVGLVSGGALANVYAAGLINATKSGTNFGSGLIGSKTGGSISNSVWDTTTSNRATGIGSSRNSQTGVAGKTTTEMKATSTFTNAGWSTATWGFKTGVNNGYPVLTGFYPDAAFTTTIYLRLIAGGSSVYGDGPAFTYGFYDASSAGSAINDATPSGAVSWSGTVPTGASNVGTYSLSYGSGITLGNSLYALQAGSAVNWTVSARPITMTAGGTSRLYGSANQTVTVFTAPSGSNGSGSGLVNSDTVSSVTNTIAGTATATANAGTIHAITPSAALFGSGSASNYAITYADGTLSISQAPATVTANSASTTYNGKSQSASGFTATGLVNGETSSVLTGVSASGSGSNAGSYSVVPTGTDANYTLSFVNGNLVIAKAAATVTGNSASTTYNGKSQSASGFTATGLVNGETSSVLTGVSASGSGSNAGSYAVLPSGSDANYTLSFVNGNLLITPAPLTVTASNASKVYGQTPTLSAFTTSGLQNGETIGSVTEVSSGSAASASVAGGPYTITSSAATGGSFSAGNYTVSYVDSRLAVTPAALTITASNASKTYDGHAYTGGSGVTYTGFVNNEAPGVLGGTVGYAGSAQGATNAGTFTITPQGLTGGNYTLSFVDGNLTINKAHLTVTADDASRIVGQANPVFTATLSGFVNNESLGSAGVGGSAAFSTQADVATPASKLPITVAQGSLAARNYDFSVFQDGTLTIKEQFVPPQLSAPSASLPAAVGGTGTSIDAATGSGLRVSTDGRGDATPVSLARQPTAQQAGIVTLSVPEELAATGGGFAFPLPAQIADSAAADNVPISVSTAAGDPLPSWLQFDPSNNTFVASTVPDGGFPIQLLVSVGSQHTTVVISWRPD